MLHAKDLEIHSATIDGKAARYTLGANDELTLTHPDISEGRHIIVLEFSGKITDAMHGLYPCYYEHNGIKKELLATQFESHHAREVFPCLDEPEAKATFDLTLATEQNIAVLSNMPIHQQNVEDNQLVTTFQTTPRMSTYLLAWVIGELHRKTALTKRGVEVNIWATPAQKSESFDFALDLATKTIDFLDDYFDTPYPLPKSDHVALPDFSAMAMENWGLITYREIGLLADPTTTSFDHKHRMAITITHELSHQWFGNLVTMEWWNDLWLNESFATLMSHVVIDALHPTWDTWLTFSVYSTAALRRDSLEGIQAVKVAVDHPDEINTLFDPAIVYAKGARLLRMLEHYIGKEAFRAGLKDYFATHAYHNTTDSDLWQALTQASRKDITQFMEAWISQPGYPVINVAQTNNAIALEQNQFFIGPHQPSAKLWPIPLNATSSALPILLEAREITVSDDSKNVRLNKGNTAHFITHYSPELFAELLEQVKNGQLTPLDRLQLLNEQTLLARADLSPSTALIPLLQAYQHETADSVWEIMAYTINELKRFVETNPTSEDKLRIFVGQLAQNHYQRLGWVPQPDEPESDTKLRPLIINFMIYSHHQEAITTALKLYRATTPPEQLSAELRALIIGAAVRFSDDPAIIDTLLNHYTTTQAGDIRQDIEAGLSTTTDPTVIARLLDLLTNDSIIRRQDTSRWFIGLIRNRYGREPTWQWLQTNWPWIQNTFGSDKSYDRFPQYSASALVTAQQLAEYKAFFMPLQSEPALKRVITVGIAEIEGRVALLERDSPSVQQALLDL